MTISAEAIKDKLRNRLFGSNVVQNNFRGELVEEMIASEIASETTSKIAPVWKHCSGDWSSWDFQRGRQLLQVKQASARQSWDVPDQPSQPRQGKFSIPPSSGYYNGAKWTSLKPPRRIAQIYIFAWHGDGSTAANHYDLEVWEFFIVATSLLDKLNPANKRNTISIPELRTLVEERKVWRGNLGELRAALETVSLACPQSDLDLDYVRP